MLRTSLEMGFFLVCGFDLKQKYNTIVRTPLYLTIHMSVCWRPNQLWTL